METERLLQRYDEKRGEIRTRLSEFKKVGRGPEMKIFEELCFCILTPQSRARNCDSAVRALSDSGVLIDGNTREIFVHLRGVRFPSGKARWIVAAREEFLVDGRWKLKERLNGFRDSYEAREWLVGSIMGLGNKEAGHFLRNIGMGEELAILDRHILKNLLRHGIINELPKTLSKKEYFRIEDSMKRFSSKIGIPLAELDLLFWSMETGEIFK